MISNKRFTIFTHAVLICAALVIFIPFYLLIIASFSKEGDVALYGYSLVPRHLSAEAYQYLLQRSDFFGRGYLVTISVTVIGVVLSLAVSMMFGYMLSRKGLPGGKVIMFLVVFTMLFSGGQVASYINYVNVLHVKNTIWGLILPNLLMNAFNVFLFRNYFAVSIPEELSEAARIDGCSEFGIFIKIMAPLSKPIVATIGLMVGIGYWNDWQNGIYYIDDQKWYGIQNILNAINTNAKYMAQQGISGASVPTEGVRMAAAVLGMLPVLIVYPLFQQYFVKGITMGSVKG